MSEEPGAELQKRVLETEAAVCAAVAARRQIYFSCDGATVVLAPHMVWRDATGASFVSGVLVSSNGPHAERGVASFPVAELQSVWTLSAPFVVDTSVFRSEAAGDVVCQAV